MASASSAASRCLALPCRSPHAASPWPRPCARPCPWRRRRPPRRGGRRRSGRRDPAARRRSPARGARSAPAWPRMAPASQAQRKSAPGLHGLQALDMRRRRAAAAGRASRPPGRGIARPTMPAAPAARASPATSAGIDGRVAVRARLARTSNASVSRASPARMAVHSSKALCTVGLPAAQVVVVHGGQVVVHQGVAVHALDGRGRVQPRPRRLRRTAPRVSITRKGRRRLPPPSAAWRIAATMRSGAPAVAVPSRIADSRRSTSCAASSRRWLKAMCFPHLAGGTDAAVEGAIF